MVYLVLGFTLGMALLIEKATPSEPALWRTLPMHVEFLLIGWILQLAIGVAYWALPRFPDNPSRGDPRPAWVAFAALNLGVWLVAFRAFPGTPPVLAPLGRTLELVAALAFTVHAWPRVRSGRCG